MHTRLCQLVNADMYVQHEYDMLYHHKEIRMLGNVEFISCKIGNINVLLTYQVFGSKNFQ